MATPTSAAKLDLTTSPPIFVLPTHLQPEELHETEDLIYQSGGRITYDAKEARVFIGRVAQKKRAAFDLRAKGVWTEEAALPGVVVRLNGKDGDRVGEEGPARKKVKLSGSDDVGTSSRQRQASSSTASPPPDEFCHNEKPASRPFWPDASNHILVLKLAWLDACLTAGSLVPYQPYLVYSAKIIRKPDGESTPTTSPTNIKTNSTASSQSPPSAERLDPMPLRSSSAPGPKQPRCPLHAAAGATMRTAPHSTTHRGFTARQPPRWNTLPNTP